MRDGCYRCRASKNREENLKQRAGRHKKGLKTTLAGVGWEKQGLRLVDRLQASRVVEADVGKVSHAPSRVGT